MRANPGKRDAPFTAGRGNSAIATLQGCSPDLTEFPRDAHGLPILDLAGRDVLKAMRYFMSVGNFTADTEAQLVIALAVRGGCCAE